MISTPPVCQMREKHPPSLHEHNLFELVILRKILSCNLPYLKCTYINSYLRSIKEKNLKKSLQTSNASA